MSNIDKRAQKELYAKVEHQAHSLRGNPREYQVVTGLCPVNVIEMHAQKIQALLDELEAADALNKHLELAIRRAEGCSEALRRKLEAAEERIAELSELPMKSDVEKKPQNTLSGRPVYLGDGSDAKETLIAGKRDIHRYGSLITDKAWKGD
ncbi:TPA: hypothetical protein I4D24_18895 [Enterobacter hormaechei]|uniref:hypothetical protein n=1 Tax=Enterobacter cloacae complex TaxID=354276 RepID=UPI0006658AC0|nr:MULTISPECIES: hypothetical protein [Enterobacter cloacae complex]CAF9428463.1 hypothetical protein AI2904V1_2607 [Enterobacter cloacae]ELJ5765051.1 hypothetical protein [Enterobacter hormaechei]MDH2557132.1 hypothetical protein [Enterobacter roggenkampii]MDL5345981.1 hypothetical protein [Enterobacter hormaechei]TQD11827.1 hypothetical protein FKC82_21405 [Enterobacter hormaechei]